GDKSAARPPDSPTNPNRTYADEGWVSWGDWLGTGSVATYKRSHRPFEQARAYARSLHLATHTAWFSWARTAARPSDIPANPEGVYRDEGWVSWGDWLGTGFVARTQRAYRPFAEARLRPYPCAS